MVVAIHDLTSRPGLAVAAWGTAFLGLWLGARGRRAAKGPWILLVALVLRLAMVSLSPDLSTDIWRYLWDGRVLAAGENPYLLEPDDPALASLRNPDWSRVEHRDVPTVYPPLALAAFSICAALPGSVWWWKLLVALVDLVTCSLLIRICRQRGLPLARSCWYAWNPLVVLETAGMGHVDALGVAGAVAAVAWLGAGVRGRLSPLAAAAGTLAKLGPIAAWPLWARTSGRPVRYLLVAGGVVAVAVAPVVVSTGGIPPGLTTYAVSWEFNGPLFEPLWRTLDGLGADHRLKGLLDAAKERTGHHERWNRFYPWVYPQLLAKAILVLAALGIWIRSWWFRDVIRGTGLLFGGLLLCSATVYPWYLLWVLPWAALRGWSSWRVLSFLAPLGYLAAPAGIALWPWLWLATWGVFFAVAIAERWREATAVERSAPS